MIVSRCSWWHCTNLVLRNIAFLIHAICLVCKIAFFQYCYRKGRNGTICVHTYTHTQAHGNKAPIGSDGNSIPITTDGNNRRVDSRPLQLVYVCL